MPEYIEQYWVLYAFGLVTSLLAFVVKHLYNTVKKQQEREQVREEGIKALLHDRIYQVGNFYLTRGYCTIEDRDNLECMFRPYVGLGGNGTGQDIYDRCRKLPYGPEKGESMDE